MEHVWVIEELYASGRAELALAQLNMTLKATGLARPIIVGNFSPVDIGLH